MSKVYMVSLAFAPARVVIECMKQVYATAGNTKFEHLILQNHYPINKELNDKVLTTVFEHYGCRVFDFGYNTGLSKGYNYLIQQCNLQEGDIVIGVDLDTWPVTQGWLDAIVKVMRADPKIGWLSLQNQHSAKELQERGFTIHTVADTICYEGNTACVQSIIGWSAKSLIQLGELREMKPMYGGMEIVSFPRLKELGLKWYYMPAYEEKFNELVKCDGPYRHYKWNYIHLNTTDLDFEAWLNEDPSRLELK